MSPAGYTLNEPLMLLFNLVVFAVYFCFLLGGLWVAVRVVKHAWNKPLKTVMDDEVSHHPETHPQT